VAHRIDLVLLFTKSGEMLRRRHECAPVWVCPWSCAMWYTIQYRAEQFWHNTCCYCSSGI